MHRNSLILTICLLAAVPAIAQAPLEVGSVEEVSIRSEQLDRAGAVRTVDGWTLEVHHPGATYIALHFSAFDLPEGESVVISDAQGGQEYRLIGRGKMDLGEFWARHIKGERALIRFSTKRSYASGFSIDRYAAGHTDIGGPDPEAICGVDDKVNAVCYENSHPVEYDRARAVARLLITGTSLCTGWLASADNHLVTNEHCISSAFAAANTDYEFMAEASSCGQGNCQQCHPGVIFDGAAFIQDNSALDYALVQITSGNPAATYGYLEIDDRDAVVGEEIYIPQHAGGKAKQLGIESSENSSGLCQVDGSASGCSSSSYQDVRYMCDTEGGSSGSPVLARGSHKVIALHHCGGGCTNTGVPIDLVCDEICDIIQTGGGCTDNADCDDGDPCTEDLCLAGSCSNDPTPTCCGNGTCELGEDCNSCAADCVSGASPSAVCGNGICEAADGENCLTCAADCNGKQNGKPSNRFCCGDGGGQNPVDCSDARCTTGGFSCSSTPGGGGNFCCGDMVCEPGEGCGNCGLDCDLGFEACGDGTDNDCDGFVDCNDSDCASDPSCQGGGGGQKGDPCTSNSDCASGKCRGPSGNKTCK